MMKRTRTKQPALSSSLQPFLHSMALIILMAFSFQQGFGQTRTNVNNTNYNQTPLIVGQKAAVAIPKGNKTHDTPSIHASPPGSVAFTPLAERIKTSDPHPEAGLFSSDVNGKELPLKRDAYSKHFENPDGSRAIETSNIPVHYKNENGYWLSIDPTIATNNSKIHPEYEFANVSNNLKSFYPANISQGILTEISGVEFTELSGLHMYYTGIDSEQVGQPAMSSNGSLSGNVMTYAEVYPFIDLRLTSKSGKRKVDYVVTNSSAFSAAPANARYVVFEETVHLPENISTKRLETGELLLIDDNGEAVAVYEVPSLVDSRTTDPHDVRDSEPSNSVSDNQIDKAFIQLKDTLIDGSLKLRLIVGLDWLRSPERVFPITIDPSISASSSSATLYSHGTNCVSATTSGAPVGSTITSVVFSFSPSNVAWYSCCYCDVYFFGCITGWYGIWNYYSGNCGSWHSWNFEGVNNVCSNQTFGTQFDGNNPNNTWDLCLTSADGYEYRADVNFSVTVNYDVPCTNPVITSNPSNRTVCENATGNFSVSATGTSLTYQWQYSSNNSSWTNIVGTWGETGYNSPNLGITNPQTHGWNGYYFRCVVYSNGICTVNSNSATLTVQTSPTAPTTIEGEANGGSTNLCEGAAITLDAGGGSNGSGATYQWYAGTTCCSGSSLGSGSTLNITPPAAGETYHVRRVGNTACTATTGSVSHRIYSRPLTDDITSVSGTNTLCEGESTTLTANGGALIHYPFTSNANDASGNGWNLTGSGGTFSSDGITLTNSSSYATAPTNVLNTDVHTIAFKLRFNGGPDGGWRQIFRWADPDFGNRSPGVWRYPNSNQMHWRYELDGTTCCGPAGANSGISEAHVYSPGTFYDIVMVKNGGILSLYIDGSLYATGAVSDPKNGGLTPLRFGGANVTLRDFRVYAADLRWYTGGCTGTYIGSGPSITVTPPSGNTTYYVQAQGECNTGTCRSRAVTVNDAPVAEAGPARSNCNSTAYTLPAGASVTGSYTNYNWTYVVNSGSVTSVTNTTTLTPTITPSSASGSVTLTLNVVGTSPCADTDDSMTFTWSSAPTANAGTDQTQCGNTANFTFSGASASTPSTWVWSIVAGSGNGSLVSGGATLTNWGFNPSTPSGTATIRLTVTGTGTCTGATATDDIIVSWIEPATLSLSSPIVSCNGDDPIDITGQTANGFFGNVLWTGGETDGSWSTGINGYYDDFSTNTSANYSMSSQANTSWNWSGGLLYSDASPGGNAYSYARYNGMNVSNRDIVIEYDMMLDGVDWGGIEYRGIYCDVNTTRTGWRDDSQAFGTGIAGVNTWHHIKMVITMAVPYPLSTLYVDGAVVFANEPIQRAAAWPRTDVGFVSSHYSPYRHYFNNFKVSEQASVFTYTPNTGVNQGAFTAYVTANGSGQCSTTDPTGNITVSWGTAPTATAGTPQTTCGTAPHPMTGATASGTYSSVAWSGGGANGAWSNTSTTDPAQWVFTPNAAYAATGGTFTATLTVTGGLGPSTACAGSDFTIARTITIDPLPQANAGPPIEICTGIDPIEMLGASAGNFSTYEWTIGLTTTNWNQSSSISTATYTPTSPTGSTTALLTVDGSGSCSGEMDSDTRTVTWNASPVITFVQGTDVTDCNTANGSILINASANETLEYSINNGSTYQSGNVFSGLSGGNYTVMVRGMTTNCATPYSGNPVVIGTTPPVTASVSVATHSLCAGQPQGSILIENLTGGGAPYDYTLFGQASNRWDLLPSDPYTVPNVIAGTYLVVVRDRFGCMSAEYSITINEPTPITITALNITDIVGCGGTGTGAISVTASGGTGTLNYSLNSIDNSPITSGTWTNLVGGSYEVGITDANGCQTLTQAQINAPWTVSAGNNIALCSGSSSQLNGHIIGEFQSPDPTDNLVLTISGSGFQDEISWTIRDNTNAVISSGGPYGYGATTTITLTDPVNSPFSFYLETQGNYNDNVVSYSISCNSSVIRSGTVSGGSTTNQTGLACYTAPATPYWSWSPTTGLSNANIWNPTVSNVTSNVTYTLTVNDDNGCVQAASVDVNVSDLDAVETLTQISCNGDDDGCIEIDAVNEVGPYLMKLGSTVQVYGGSMKEVTITNTNGTLTNHPVKISNIAWTAPMRADFGDVRFYDANLNELSYWIESYTNSGSMDAWVKFPSLGASAIVYMTFGNSTLGSESDGDAVFEFFDDFDFFNASKWTQGTINTTTGTNWSYFGGELIGGNTNRTLTSTTGFTGNKVNEARTFETSSAGNGFTSAGFWSSTGNGLSILNHNGTNYARNDGTWPNFTGWGAGPRNVWIREQVRVVGTGSLVSRTRETSGTLSATYNNSGLSNEPLRLGARGDNSATNQNFSGKWDWIFVRPYAATEPTASIGSVITADNEFCDLAPGSYSVQVVDMGNCSETVNFTISEPTVLTLSQDNYAIVCNGLTNGNIDITVSGGTPTYYYNWAGPSSYSSSSEDITGLAPGNYNITVADDNACTVNGSFLVSEYPEVPAPPTVTADPTTTCIDNDVDLTATGLAPCQDVATFNGSSSYVRVVQDIPEVNFTIELWFKTSSANTGIFSVTENDPPGVGGHDRHLFLTGGTLAGRVWPGGAWNSGVPLNDGNWHHVALTVQSSVGQKLYVNGNLVLNDPQDQSNFNWQTRFLIGYSADAANTNFDGEISNVRIWNTVRSAAQVQNDMYLLDPSSATGLVAHLPLNGNAIASVGNDGTFINGSYGNQDYYSYTWSGTGSPSISPNNTALESVTVSSIQIGQEDFDVYATAAGCSQNNTNSTSVTIEAQPSIALTSGSNQGICSGGNPTGFTALLSNGIGCGYQWQSSIDGTTWNDIAGATTNSYNPTGVTNSTFYRCVTVSCQAGCTQASSEVRFVAVTANPPTVSIQPSPASQSVCEGDNVTYTAQANIGSGPTLYRLVLTSAYGNGWHGIQEIRGFDSAGTLQALTCSEASSATYSDNHCGYASYGASNAFDGNYNSSGHVHSGDQWLTPERNTETGGSSFPNTNWQNYLTENPFYSPEWIEWSSPQPLSEIHVYNGRYSPNDPTHGSDISDCFKDFYVLVSHDGGASWEMVNSGTMNGVNGIDGTNNMISLEPEYTWKRGATTVGTGNTLSMTNVTTANSGNYAVELTYGCGTPTVSNTASLTVRPTPTASISGTTLVCLNDAAPNLTFTNPHSLPVTVTYTVNSGANQTVNVGASTSATVAQSTAVAGTYIYDLVSVAYQSAPACSNTISGSATITIPNVGVPSAITGPSIICHPGSATYSVTNVGGMTYNWTVPAFLTGSSASNSLGATTTSAPGSGNITVTAEDGNGCESGNQSISVSTSGLGNMTWLGTTSDGDWHDPINWGCYGLPNATSDVMVPVTSYDPHLFNGQGDCNTITIDTDGGAHLFVDPGGSLNVQ